MKAMILAAGKGSRLRPLTDTCPKPLISVGGKPLIVHHIERLKQAGIVELVINVHHLADQIMEYLGTGDAWGVRIQYSPEALLLETGGGICTALPLLGHQPFILVNADIWTDFDFSLLLSPPQDAWAYLILVDNPVEHPEGDYVLQDNEQIALPSPQGNVNKTYTYAGIARLDPMLFEGYRSHQVFRLPAIFDNARIAKKLMGRYYSGRWTDVGTWERLTQLRHALEG